MKRFYRLLFIGILFVGIFVLLPQQTYALSCTCQNPNTPGQTTMDCTDGSQPSCAGNQVCTGTNNNAKCQDLTCRCDTAGNPNDGSNGFSCDVNGQSNVYRAYCSNGNACIDPVSPSTTITCEVPPSPPTQPPQPPPPCVHLSTQSHCDSVSTAFGTFSTDPAHFIASFFEILLGLAGSLAVLLVVYSGYQMMMSRGNPEKLQNAREQLTAAIIGLLFMIFSFVILQIIGVDILGIPGFTP